MGAPASWPSHEGAVDARKSAIKISRLLSLSILHDLLIAILAEIAGIAGDFWIEIAKWISLIHSMDIVGRR